MLRFSVVGYSRRREAREIAEAIEDANRRIAGVTLGQVCAANLVVLEISCRQIALSTLTNLSSAVAGFTSPGVTRISGYEQTWKPITHLEPLIAGVPNLRARMFSQECL